MAIVAIFSGSYCHGDEVAQLVAECLKYDRIEEKLLGETSCRFESPKPKLIRAMTDPATLFNKYTRERQKNIEVPLV